MCGGSFYNPSGYNKSKVLFISRRKEKQNPLDLKAGNDPDLLIRDLVWRDLAPLWGYFGTEMKIWFCCRGKKMEPKSAKSQNTWTALMKHLQHPPNKSRDQRLQELLVFLCCVKRGKAFPDNGSVHLRPNNPLRAAGSRIWWLQNISLVFPLVGFSINFHGDAQWMAGMTLIAGVSA